MLILIACLDDLAYSILRSFRDFITSFIAHGNDPAFDLKTREQSFELLCIGKGVAMLKLFDGKGIQAQFGIVVQLHWDVVAYCRFFDMRLGDRQDLLNDDVEQMPKFGEGRCFQRSCAHDTSVQRRRDINLAMA